MGAKIERASSDYLHQPARVYPNLKDGVTVTTHATSWELGSAATLVGTAQNLDNAGAADAGGGLTRIPLTGHGYIVGDYVQLAGTTNYDGIYEIMATSDSDHFDITATFETEAFSGSETSTDCVGTSFDVHFVFIEALNTNDKTYQINFYRTDTDALIGQLRMEINANKSDPGGIPLRMPILPAGTGIYVKAAIKDGGSKTARLSVYYHTHP